MKKLLASLILTITLCSTALADWHILYLHPNGDFKALYAFTPGDPETDIANTISESISANQGGPYHVIVGEYLNEAPVRQVYHIGATAGVLLFQNIANP